MEQPRVMTPKVKSYKISAKCEVELHPYNVVCFKNCLNKSAQKRLLMECGRIMEIGNNPNLISRGKFSAISKKAVPVLFWNWPAVKESLKYKETYQPSDLLDFTARLFDIARDKIKAEEDSGMVKYANSRGSNLLFIFIICHLFLAFFVCPISLHFFLCMSNSVML